MKSIHIPAMGYGTWNRSGKEAYNGVIQALNLGYRHIDTAQAYNNEEEVGHAIVDSTINRHELFLTTKVDPINYAPGKILPSVEESLKKLNVPHVDLLLLHFPSLHNEYDAYEYCTQMLDVKERGLTTHIGVSNFTKHYLDIAAEIWDYKNIYTNQIEIHAYMQNQAIVDYCRVHNIQTTAYSPLARGKLIHDPILTKIAKKHSATTAQVALAFLLNEGHIVIPSSTNKERAKENYEANNIVLSEAEIIAIRKLERGLRLVDEDWCPKWDI